MSRQRISRKWRRQAGVDRHAFGKYVEDVKRGMDRGGADNLTFRDLLDLAYEFLEFFGGT